MIARNHFQIIFWLSLLGTIGLSLMPVSGQQIFELQDKFGHATVYAILYFFVGASLRPPSSPVAFGRNTGDVWIINGAGPIHDQLPLWRPLGFTGQ